MDEGKEGMERSGTDDDADEHGGTGFVEIPIERGEMKEGRRGEGEKGEEPELVVLQDVANGEGEEEGAQEHEHRDWNRFLLETEN